MSGNSNGVVRSGSLGGDFYDFACKVSRHVMSNILTLCLQNVSYHTIRVHYITTCGVRDVFTNCQCVINLESDQCINVI